MLISSRIFGIEINGTSTDIVAPMADMLNHRNEIHTTWSYDNASCCFVIKALENIAPGSEIYDSYGCKSQHRFLLNYGYVN
jgi:histone-lysine N-methyltransferase SETD3